MQHNYHICLAVSSQSLIVMKLQTGNSNINDAFIIHILLPCGEYLRKLRKFCLKQITLTDRPRRPELIEKNPLKASANWLQLPILIFRFISSIDPSRWKFYLWSVLVSKLMIYLTYVGFFWLVNEDTVKIFDWLMRWSCMQPSCNPNGC